MLGWSGRPQKGKGAETQIRWEKGPPPSLPPALASLHAMHGCLPSSRILSGQREERSKAVGGGGGGGRMGDDEGGVGAKEGVEGEGHFKKQGTHEQGEKLREDHTPAPATKAPRGLAWVHHGQRLPHEGMGRLGACVGAGAWVGARGVWRMGVWGWVGAPRESFLHRFFWAEVGGCEGCMCAAHNRYGTRVLYGTIPPHL